MEMQNEMMVDQSFVTAEEGALSHPPAEDAYRILAEENRLLSQELSKIKAEYEQNMESQRGEQLLEKLVGSRNQPLFERALKRACSEELAALPHEKRYEVSYLLCLGEDARAKRSSSLAGDAPPPFAHSAGNGQVALSMTKTPTSFEMAKENAKKYFKH